MLLLFSQLDRLALPHNPHHCPGAAPPIAGWALPYQAIINQENTSTALLTGQYYEGNSSTDIPSTQASTELTEN